MVSKGKGYEERLPEERHDRQETFRSLLDGHTHYECSDNSNPDIAPNNICDSHNYLNGLQRPKRVLLGSG